MLTHKAITLKSILEVQKRAASNHAALVCISPVSGENPQKK